MVSFLPDLKDGTPINNPLTSLCNLGETSKEVRKNKLILTTMKAKVKISDVVKLDNQIIAMTAEASRFKFWSQEARDIQYRCDIVRIERRNKVALLSQKQLTSYLSKY